LIGSTASPTAKKELRLTYEIYRNVAFQRATSKLRAFGFDQKTSYHVMRIVKAIAAQEKTAQEQFLEVVKRHAELDEKGEIKPTDPSRPGSFKVRDGAEEAFHKDAAAWEATEFTCDKWEPLLLSDVAACRLSADELDVLAPLLDMSSEPS
jgi:hypothetical protein